MKKIILILSFIIFLTWCNNKNIISENNKEENIKNSNWLTIEEIEKREIELKERTKKREEMNKKYDGLNKEEINKLIETEREREIWEREREERELEGEVEKKEKGMRER